MIFGSYMNYNDYIVTNNRNEITFVVYINIEHNPHGYQERFINFEMDDIDTTLEYNDPDVNNKSIDVKITIDNFTRGALIQLNPICNYQYRKFRYYRYFYVDRRGTKHYSTDPDDLIEDYYYNAVAPDSIYDDYEKYNADGIQKFNNVSFWEEEEDEDGEIIDVEIEFDMYLFYEEVYTSWTSTSTTLAMPLSVYTQPYRFYFRGTDSNGNKIETKSGDKYPISNIQTLLINIYNFDNVATAWKRWKEQTDYNNCYSFKRGTILTAKAMNDAHAYLGTNNTYKQGDKISAEMFTILEDKLNN